MASNELKWKYPEKRELLGGDLLAQTLFQLGVEVSFGIHGGHLDAFLIGCNLAGIKLIDTRHEATAVQAAEGYAKVSGKVGCAFVTANSGYVFGPLFSSSSHEPALTCHSPSIKILQRPPRHINRIRRPLAGLRGNIIAAPARSRDELPARVPRPGGSGKATHEIRTPRDQR